MGMEERQVGRSLFWGVRDDFETFLQFLTVWRGGGGHKYLGLNRSLLDVVVVVDLINRVHLDKMKIKSLC